MVFLTQTALSLLGCLPLGRRKRRIPGLLAAVEDLGQERKKNRPSGKKEDRDHRDDLRDLLQVLPDLPELIPGPFLACVPVLHEETHEAANLHHLFQDELAVPENEPFQIRRDFFRNSGGSPTQGS